MCMCRCVYMRICAACDLFYLRGKVRPAQQQVFTRRHGFTTIKPKNKWQHITFNDPDKRSTDPPAILLCRDTEIVAQVPHDVDLHSFVAQACVLRCEMPGNSRKIRRNITGISMIRQCRLSRSMIHKFLRKFHQKSQHSPHGWSSFPCEEQNLI